MFYDGIFYPSSPLSTEIFTRTWVCVCVGVGVIVVHKVDYYDWAVLINLCTYYENGRYLVYGIYTEQPHAVFVYRGRRAVRVLLRIVATIAVGGGGDEGRN